ncbi:MAG: cation-transporting P-type ATPase [Candidatus Helarchaeota archaeon]|nr:cation-transporting P-type ATPase [Candidatus Helarchaeota archaeon]
MPENLPLVEAAENAANSTDVGAEEILSMLKTNLNGLTSEEAARRVSIFGRNALPEKGGTPFWKIILGQLNNIPVILLLVAAAVSFILSFIFHKPSELIDGVAILAAVAVVVILGFRSEWSSQNAVKALKKLAVPRARVIRNKKEIEINSETLVPGDILNLKTGSRIPADVRIIEAYEVEADESLLTGESMVVQKYSDKLLSKEVPLAERKNMLFMGTTLMKGTAKAVVVASGQKTQMGNIAKLTSELEEHKTPLQQRLNKLGKQIGMIGIIVCVLVFIVGLLAFWLFDPDAADPTLFDEQILILFTTAVALAVAAIPEGLPIVVTIILSLGTSRMAKRNAIVTRLNSVETLGCTRTICTDKTGTLTQNKMTVRYITLGDWEDYHVSGEAYELTGKFHDSNHNEVEGTRFQKFVEIGVRCNDSNLAKDEDGNLHVLGSAIEGALLILAYKAGQEPAKLRTQNVTLEGQIPFNSETKRMVSVYRTSKGVFAYIKGAPDSILANFSKIDTGDLVNDFTEADRAEYMRNYEQFADMALYMLALGYKQLPDNFSHNASSNLEEEIEANSGFTFVGFVGVQDPPRPEVKESIRLCHEAGMDVVMITGDNARTARSIAQELEILRDQQNEIILSGSEIDHLSDTELDGKIEKVRICSRVTPEHKLKIVQSLQRENHVAAMTGDGVNDVPALKQADIGVAMGSGTDVAKSAGNMILVDDNFTTIVSAVEEGRSIYSNIKKFITFQLSTTISSILIVFILAIVPEWQSLYPLQILWINMIMDGPPAQSLGVEPKEPGIMKYPPRPYYEEIISSQMRMRIVLSAILRTIIVLTLYGIYFEVSTPQTALTVAFTSFIFLQLFNAYNCRSPIHSIFKLPPNKMLFLTTGVCAIIQILIVYFTPSDSVFYVTPLTLLDWGIILAAASSIIIVEEIRKVFIRRRRNRSTP